MHGARVHQSILSAPGEKVRKGLTRSADAVVSISDATRHTAVPGASQPLCRTDVLRGSLVRFKVGWIGGTGLSAPGSAPY